MPRRSKKTVFQSEEFLKLRREWYDKLKESGFKDIEHIDWTDGESGNLLNGMSLMDMLRSYKPEQQRYFELAIQNRQRIYVRHYKGYLEQWHVTAWTMHSNGKSFQYIEDNTGIPRRTVAAFIQKEAKRMLKLAAKRAAEQENEDVGE